MLETGNQAQMSNNSTTMCLCTSLELCRPQSHSIEEKKKSQSWCGNMHTVSMEEEEFDRWRDTQTLITVPVLREFIVMETNVDEHYITCQNVVNTKSGN